MQLVTVNSQPPYPVYLSHGLLSQLGSLYRQAGLGGRAMVVSDDVVFKVYGQTVMDGLKQNDVEAVSTVVPAGESSKCLDIADQIYEQLIHHRFERTSAIVALGGGVVGDLAGFVAATYLRGISLVQAPTTLLAQVDSSVGGKTGVNHELGKNLIGAFYNPSLVVADIATLSSLPEREWRSGLAEVIKYGVIADRDLFDKVESLLPELNPKHPELESIISRCVEIKAGVVEKDERESGLRKILNFGHTLGHALESYTNYDYFKHGEAVLWGMLGEAFLSYKFGQLREMEVMRLRRMISRLDVPPLPPLDEAEFLAHARRDKKNRDGKIHILWLKHIGHCQSGPISSENLAQVLSFWKSVSAKAAS